MDKETVFGGVDYLPTIPSLIGADYPDTGMDGQDLSRAFLGIQQKRDKILFWSDKPEWVALRDNQWKAHIRKGKFTLYDLENDPSESNDLSGSMTEKALKYRTMLNDWSKVIHRDTKETDFPAMH